MTNAQFLPSSELTDDLRLKVRSALGREPRGLEGVAAWTPCGEPAVIQVASLVDGKPFPTLFWLIDKDIGHNIDRLEAKGLIKAFQAKIDSDKALQAALIHDHEAYIAQRARLMREDVKQKLASLGYLDGILRRGIGGIANFTRIRCFHTYYAAHMVNPNTVGRMLDDYWASEVLS